MFSADADKDGFVTMEELEAAVVNNIQHHMDESIRQNSKVFSVIDQDSDGLQFLVLLYFFHVLYPQM